MTGFVVLDLECAVSDGSPISSSRSHTYDMHCEPSQELIKPDCGVTIFVKKLTPYLSQYSRLLARRMPQRTSRSDMARIARVAR
jgi:hypothetical protein